MDQTSGTCSETRSSLMSELPLSRKCTEEHLISDIPLSTTPEKDNELKRRRLTSESQGALQLRGHFDSSVSPGSSEVSEQTAQFDDVERVLKGHLEEWSRKLIDLQPKVLMDEHLINCGLTLFKHLRQLQVVAWMEGRFPQDYLASDQLLMHDLIACWWIALKHCSVRTAVPNRTLMSRATGARPDVLADRELAALVGMDWDVNAVLRDAALIA